ncbi:unnamed protein product [Polarella glacialis]|uniref:Uncharacterized protein n=1 Tax=Polarella glacialis TaxID=89957 RepID=A0A813DE73_POLGL|nr:unnamed protein product [Polarella glacialis]
MLPSTHTYSVQSHCRVARLGTGRSSANRTRTRTSPCSKLRSAYVSGPRKRRGGRMLSRAGGCEQANGQAAVAYSNPWQITRMPEIVGTSSGDDPSKKRRNKNYKNNNNDNNNNKNKNKNNIHSSSSRRNNSSNNNSNNNNDNSTNNNSDSNSNSNSNNDNNNDNNKQQQQHVVLL